MYGDTKSVGVENLDTKDLPYGMMELDQSWGNFATNLSAYVTGEHLAGLLSGM